MGCHKSRRVTIPERIRPKLRADDHLLRRELTESQRQDTQAASKLAEVRILRLNTRRSAVIIGER